MPFSLPESLALVVGIVVVSTGWTFLWVSGEKCQKQPALKQKTDHICQHTKHTKTSKKEGRNQRRVEHKSTAEKEPARKKNRKQAANAPIFVQRHSNGLDVFLSLRDDGLLLLNCLRVLCIV